MVRGISHKSTLFYRARNAGPPPGVAPTDPVTGFRTEETESYTVNADCTGHFEIDFPPFTTAGGGMVKGAIIQVKFVLSDHGRAIHAIVTSLAPRGHRDLSQR